MAINYRDVKLKSDKRLEKKQDKRQQFRAVITDQFGNQSGAGDIWFSRTQRKVWAMKVGGTQPYPYYCYRIKPSIGVGVIIGYSSPLNQLPEVLQTDTEFLGPSNTTGTAYESPDNEDFLPGGRLQLWLDTRLIQSLAIYPDATGLFVNVTNGDYIYAGERKTFDGEENIDLSASQPGAGLHRYVGLYLDSSNLLQTVDGATIALASTPAQPTWPAGSYRLGMVRINDTQTSFSMADDIVNLKIPWTDEESFGTGAWPNAGEIKIGDTVYATLAAAQAVAVSPDVVKLGEGSYPSNNLVFATGVSMASAGNATITQTSDANCLTITNATIRDINFSVSINSANTRSALIFVDSCYAYNVRISGSNAGAGVVDGFAYAGSDEVYLGDCESIVDGDAVNINNMDAIVTIANGIYSGGTGGIEVVAGFADLLMPHITSNNVTAHPASRGQWFDSNAHIKIETVTETLPVDTDLFPFGDTDYSFGINWVSWANIKATLKTYFDTLYAATFTILSIARGGTNSGTALSNNRVMQSSAGAIVEAAAITAARALVSDANGIPVAATTTTTEINFVNGVTSAIQTQLDARIAKAFLDAKGDLISASANDTPAILSVGSDGQRPEADSAQTTGIKWSWPSFLTAADGSPNPALSADNAGDLTAVGNLTVADNKWIGLGSSAGQIEFDDQATDEVNILNANVGIGTSTPAYKVDVSGEVVARQFLTNRVSGLADDTATNFQPVTVGNRFWFFFVTNGGEYFLGVDTFNGISTIANSGCAVVAGGGTLTGTTGPDGTINLRDDAGTLYVENRRGSARNLGVMFGGSD